jgi:hypothetical protein
MASFVVSNDLPDGLSKFENVKINRYYICMDIDDTPNENDLVLKQDEYYQIGVYLDKGKLVLSPLVKGMRKKIDPVFTFGIDVVEGGTYSINLCICLGATLERKYIPFLEFSKEISRSILMGHYRYLDIEKTISNNYEIKLSDADYPKSFSTVHRINLDKLNHNVNAPIYYIPIECKFVGEIDLARINKYEKELNKPFQQISLLRDDFTNFKNFTDDSYVITHNQLSLLRNDFKNLKAISEKEYENTHKRITELNQIITEMQEDKVKDSEFIEKLALQVISLQRMVDKLVQLVSDSNKSKNDTKNTIATTSTTTTTDTTTDTTENPSTSTVKKYYMSTVYNDTSDYSDSDSDSDSVPKYRNGVNIDIAKYACDDSDSDSDSDSDIEIGSNIVLEFKSKSDIDINKLINRLSCLPSFDSDDESDISDDMPELVSDCESDINDGMPELVSDGESYINDGMPELVSDDEVENPLNECQLEVFELPPPPYPFDCYEDSDNWTGYYPILETVSEFDDDNGEVYNENEVSFV